MNFNISRLLELKSLKRQFEQNHPKFFPFLAAAQKQALQEGSVIEITVTSPKGEVLSSNIKVKASDLALLEKARELSKEFL